MSPPPTPATKRRPPPKKASASRRPASQRPAAARARDELQRRLGNNGTSQSVEAFQRSKHEGRPNGANATAPVIVNKAEVDGSESEEWLRQKYASEGIYYEGQPQWDEANGTWWLDRDQILRSETFEFGEAEVDVVVGTATGAAQSDETDEVDEYLDAVQLTLDIAGLVPGFGEVADGANALISLSRGDYLGASLSAAAMIPFIGWGATASKGAKRAADVVGEAGSVVQRSHRSGAVNAALDEAIEAIEAERFVTSELLRLQPHRAATKARNSMGVSGGTHQSSHFGPQSALRELPHYDAKNALTQILPTGVHRRFDAHWLAAVRQMRRNGKETLSAQELHTIVANAVRALPDFSEAEKVSMIAHLTDELFFQLALRQSDMVRLPGVR